MIKDAHCCDLKAIFNVNLYLWLHADILATIGIAHFSSSLVVLKTSSRRSIKAMSSKAWLIAK